jgi:2-oxoglutarate dehydrogenase E1 component
LRHRAAVSDLSAFGPGTQFLPVLGATVRNPAEISRVVLCSGKIAYELEAALQADDRTDVAVVRVEQLYPFPEKGLHAELARFPEASVLWCQEEPENMGAWSYLDRKIERVLRAIGNSCEWPHCVSRPANASTAIGMNDEHLVDQANLVASAIAARSDRQKEVKSATG